MIWYPFKDQYSQSLANQMRGLFGVGMVEIASKLKMLEISHFLKASQRLFLFSNEFPKKYSKLPENVRMVEKFFKAKKIF